MKLVNFVHVCTPRWGPWAVLARGRFDFRRHWATPNRQLIVLFAITLFLTMLSDIRPCGVVCHRELAQTTIACRFLLLDVATRASSPHLSRVIRLSRSAWPTPSLLPLCDASSSAFDPVRKTIRTPAAGGVAAACPVTHEETVILEENVV